MTEKAMAVARLGDLAIRATDSAAFIHAFFAVGFGVSLIVSDYIDRVEAAPSYDFLRSIPGWPTTVGLLMVAAGFLLFGGTLLRFAFCRYHLRVIGFTLEAIVMGAYGGLFIAGTLASETTIIGPQWIYMLVSSLAALRAVHSAQAVRVTSGERSSGV